MSVRIAFKMRMYFLQISQFMTSVDLDSVTARLSGYLQY